ncbi:MAG: HNH endonuclease [Myxococcales bacterium]|nr:HNH endonuclease [Myxococcales bacterium]
MRGYVGVTDPGWYEHLSQELGPKDANFWRPSTRRVLLDVGTPFFFKLKAPYNAIAGFGYFAGFSLLPDWLAWETFGRANGVPNLAALQERLARIRKGARIDASPGRELGCCLIAEARFFEPSAWVATPADWSPRTQTGSSYDLSQGEGLRIWMECQARVAGTERATAAASAAREPDAPRYGEPALHAPRLGQGIFRVRVLDAYGRACAVTREHSLPVLEAAHIKPYSEGGQHSVANGLTLRSDLHRLFDRGYVTVDERLRFVVGRRLKDDFDNGRSYYGLAGTELTVPDVTSRPFARALEWHRDQVFLG